MAATTSTSSVPDGGVDAPVPTGFRRFVAGAAVWYLIYLALPSDLSGIWYVLGALCAITLVALRSRRLPSEVRSVTTLLLLAGVSAISGGIIRGIESMLTGEDDPVPSIADIGVAGSYILLVAAALLMVHKRMPKLTMDPLLDALVGTIAVGVLQWTLVIIPYVRLASPDDLALALNLGYATGSLMLVGIAILALVAGGHRSASNRILAGALFATVAIDAMTTLVLADAMPEWIRTAAAPLGIMLGTAGLLHPSVVLLTSRPTDVSQLRRLTRKRIAVLGLALIACPVLLFALILTDSWDRTLLPAAAALALAPLVVVRLARLVRQNEELATLEAGLRAVGERLVSAETTDDVARIITVGSEQVLQDKFLGGGLVLDPLAASQGVTDTDALAQALEPVRSHREQ
ncbi:MAG: hypothetical protein ACK4V6_05435, partial [Microthrixaceae bacterium]